MNSTAGDTDRRKLIKRFRVFYDQNQRQAPGHEDYFTDIQTLGEYDVDNYRSDITIESRQRPWRQKTLSRAKVVSAKARRCLEAHKNEASWRLGLETDIISRFSIEVICPECRARLWRSELEVALTDVDGSIDDLANRQKNRQSCQCSSRHLGDDRSDEGLNPLFDDRAEEEIEYESEIEKILKAGKRPDRLLGLRATKRLEKILDEGEGPNGEPLGNCIKTSPLKASCDPLLFPFLVLEAKSEKSSDTFSKIRLQTSFAIRALLDLQRNLAHATTDNHQSAMKPLVWSLSSKGEIWRLSGAYVEETKDATKPNYRILELWEGNITYEHHSLRLLLILDYIFDWARDVYRKEIVSSLLSLATNATPSLAAEIDVFSTAGNLIDVAQMQEFDTDGIGQETQPFDVPHLLRFFDGRDISFRDARYMRYTLCALHVTLDNLDSFLNSVKTMRAGQKLARKLWRALLGSSTWSVTASCLNAVEKLWTGKDRETQTFSNPEDSYLAAFTVRSYLTGGDRSHGHDTERAGLWDPTHELTYVTIAHDALEALRTRTTFSTRSLLMRIENCPRVPEEWVLAQFERLRLAPVRQSFGAAICRSTMLSESSRSFNNTQPRFAAFANVHGRIMHYTPSLTRSGIDRTPNSAQLPWIVYWQLKVGRLEPSQSFLRVSQQVSKHQSENACAENSLWPIEDIRFLSACDSCLVAGVTSGDGNDPNKTISVRHCVFLFDPSPVYTAESNREEAEFVSSSKVLCTVLNLLSRSQQSCNMLLRFHPELELPVALKILKHVSSQYQLALCTDSIPSNQWTWIKSKQKQLESSEMTKWPFNLAQTISGIEEVGILYNFDQILRWLTAGFTKAITIQKAHHLDNPEQYDSVGSTTGSASRSSDRRSPDDDELIEIDLGTFLHASAPHRVKKSPKKGVTEDEFGVNISRKRKEKPSSTTVESEDGRKPMAKRSRVLITN